MAETAAKNNVVLVVEDDHAVNDKVCDALDGAGFEPVAAYDGDDALRLARARRPALILLDLNLPDADGVHICRTLMNTPATRKIPIIVFTGRTDLTSKFSCFVAGAHRYLTKPVDHEELMREVQDALCVRQT